MYVDRSANNYGAKFLCSFERTDNIQINDINFSYNRFSAGSSDSMGKYRLQQLFSNSTWNTRFNLPKNDHYSTLSTQWTIFSLNLKLENCWKKLIYEKVDFAWAGMRFSKNKILLSLYWEFKHPFSLSFRVNKKIK